MVSEAAESSTENKTFVGFLLLPPFSLSASAQGMKNYAQRHRLKLVHRSRLDDDDDDDEGGHE